MNAQAGVVTGPVLIMAGGTGGHIFPGIAVALELRARQVPVLWLGSAGGLETRLVPEAGLPIRTLAISGVRGKGPLTVLMAPLRILRALIAAWMLLGRERPASALALGGFAAGPGGIAAWLRGVPLVVHEQNRVPGLTNRILSRFAKMRLCGFRDALRARVSGWAIPFGARLPPCRRRRSVSLHAHGTPRLLVLGGSQGAYNLNVVLPQVLQCMPQALRLLLRHQTGPKHLAKTTRIYAAAGVDAQVEAFIDDMAAAYAWADLVVCRAGALTLAELCAAGLPAILVPFPAAVDDHQTRNAEELVACGAARLIAEGETFPQRLGAALGDLLGGADDERRPRLLAMAQAARTLAKPDAAARIADACLEAAA